MPMDTGSGNGLNNTDTNVSDIGGPVAGSVSQY
jgi:hypothetical protein